VAKGEKALESSSSDESSRGWEAVLSHQASLSALRHELRTPLNAIIGYSEMMLEDAIDEGREEFIADLQKIHAASEELLALVNKTLDWESIKSEKSDLDLETMGAQLDFALRTRLNAIIGYTEMLVEGAEGAETEEFVPDLQNILEAAKQFLALTGQVRAIGAAAVEPSPEYVHDSRVVMQETLTDGRSLGVEVPAALTEAAFVLVVDDGELNRDVLTRHLKRQGHAVAEAANGREALEMVSKHSFDLVLLDIMMPEVDGYQVLQRLKSHDAWRDIPVIMISAVDEIDSVVRCIEMGAEDYLPKPFDPVLLRARINACLEKKRVRDREVEYLRQVTCVTDAAAAIEAEMFEPGSLAAVAARSDALGQLARVFQRMAREVYAREQRLKQEVLELRIELDEVRQARQLAEITDTEYFHRLEAKAEDLRKIIDGPSGGAHRDAQAEEERR
jgi:DNA-binding response OmpR family regulator